jgi:F0F1-type ATP synthase assembly protein I
MTTMKKHTHIMEDSSRYTAIFMISAWGFAIVVSSLIFLYAGWWIDQKFDSAPTFMLGLFFLGVFLCVGRLYWEVWERRGKCS